MWITKTLQIREKEGERIMIGKGTKPEGHLYVLLADCGMKSQKPEHLSEIMPTTVYVRMFVEDKNTQKDKL